MTPSSTTCAGQSAPKHRRARRRPAFQHHHACARGAVPSPYRGSSAPEPRRRGIRPLYRTTRHEGHFLQGSTSPAQPARSPGKAKSALHWRSPWPTPRRLVHAAYNNAASTAALCFVRAAACAPGSSIDACRCCFRRGIWSLLRIGAVSNHG